MLWTLVLPMGIQQAAFNVPLEWFQMRICFVDWEILPVHHHSYFELVGARSRHPRSPTPVMSVVPEHRRAWFLCNAV